jgi:hypothetical protein
MGVNLPLMDSDSNRLQRCPDMDWPPPINALRLIGFTGVMRFLIVLVALDEVRVALVKDPCRSPARMLLVTSQ